MINGSAVAQQQSHRSTTHPIERAAAARYPAGALDLRCLCRHSGPQGKVEPLTIVDDPADWKASDWEGRESEYTYRFTSEVRGAEALCKGGGQLGEGCQAVKTMKSVGHQR